MWKGLLDADYVLEWIPPQHENVLSAGKWNKIATNNEWQTLLQYRGLHLCPLPRSYTRVAPDGSTSILDGAAITSAEITELTCWQLSDHLALHITFCPEQAKARRFPNRVLDDLMFQHDSEECTRIWANIVNSLSRPQDLCLAWDGFKQSLIDPTH